MRLSPTPAGVHRLVRYRRGRGVSLVTTLAVATALAGLAVLVAPGSTGPASASAATAASTASTRSAAADSDLDTGFEDGTAGSWAPRGPVTLSAGTEQARTGTHSLLTTGRTANWNGPALDLSGRVSAGHLQAVSVWVRMASGTDTVAMTVEARVDGADATYTRIGSAAPATDTGWTELSGTWTPPAGATALTLYVEGAADTSSYYIDDFALADLTDPGPTEPGDGPQTLFAHDFENGASGWSARGGGETVAVSTAAAHGGTASLAVTGRTASWNAPVLSVLGRFKPGTAYTISAWVRLAEGTDPTTAKLTMERRLAGTPTYEGITGGTAVTADGWTRITGTYTLAADVDFLTLYVETPGTESFFVDDVQVTYTPSLPIQTDIASLKDEFATYWPRTGAAVSLPEIIGDHATLLQKHFNSLTPGNAMKWGSVEPVKGSPNYADADRIVDFAQAHGIGVYGHVLAWHSQIPDWVFRDDEGNALPLDAASKQLVLDRLSDHIREEAGRYRGRVYAWDVVNEVISDDGDPDGEKYRQSDFYRYTGLDFIRTAFRVAHETDPAAQLCINDYNTTGVVKRDKYFDLVKQLLAEGVPIDCVGHQMHVHADGPSKAEVEAALAKFETLGVRQRITELDVSVYDTDDDTGVYETVPQAQLDAQKAEYQALFEAFLDHAAGIDSVTLWGLADDDTWLSTFPITRLNTPLLFDNRLQAKPVFDTVVQTARSHTTPTPTPSPSPTTPTPSPSPTFSPTPSISPTPTLSPTPTPTVTPTTTPPARTATITPAVTLRDDGTAYAGVLLSGSWCLRSGTRAVAISRASSGYRVSAPFGRVAPGGYLTALGLPDTARTGLYDVYVDGVQCSGAKLTAGSAAARIGSFRALSPTSLTVDATPEPVRRGATLTLTGTLRHLAAGRVQGYRGAPVVIEFQARGSDRWTTIATVTSGAGGTFTLRTPATAGGTWRARHTPDADHTASTATDAVEVK
jgi:endo-1,4-beta-xylanase